jgi:outer membrane protein assembly factor BamB
MTGAPGEEADAYTTPLLVHHEGEPQLVVMGANQLDAYDPRNGRRLWYLDALTGGRTVTSPTMAEGTVFATRGKRGPLLAVPLVTRWAHDTPLARPRRDILWSDSAGTPDCCTPVAQGLLLFTVSDDGVARCHDARTGSQKWKQRLPGQYKASPVIVAGRVLFLNTQGVCTVVSATADYDKLAENQLEDAMFASPALAHEHIYLRGSQTLYCIGRRFP